MDRAAPLTSKRIENARAAPGERYELSDGGTGLRVRIGPGGKVFRWYVHGKDGKRRVIALGRFSPEPREGHLTLAEARRKLLDLKAAHAAGTLGDAAAGRGAPKTVGDLLDLWLAEYVAVHHRRPEVTKRIVQADLKAVVGARQLATLSPRGVAEAVEKVVRRGARVHAGKVFSIFKTALSWGVGRGYIALSPAVSLQPKALGAVHRARARTLTDEELRKVWLALEDPKTAMMPVTKLAIRLIALTGVRSSVVIEAQREEFTFSGAPPPAVGLWTVPPERMKMKKSELATAAPTVIPLSADAADVVRKLFDLAESRWLCASPHSSGTGHLNLRTLHWPIEAMCKRLGIPRWAPHDLRRTLRTWAGDTGEDGKPQVDFAVAEALLQHKLPTEVARIYDRGTLLRARAVALHDYANHIRALMGKPPADGQERGGRVVAFKRG